MLSRAASKAGEAWRNRLAQSATSALSGRAETYLSRYAGLIKPYIDSIELFYRHSLVPSLAAAAQLMLAIAVTFSVNSTVAVILFGELVFLLILTVGYAQIHSGLARSQMVAEEAVLVNAALNPRKGLSIWFGGWAPFWFQRRTREIRAAARARRRLWTAETLFYSASTSLAGLFIVAGYWVLVDLGFGSLRDFTALFLYCGLMLAPVMRVAAAIPEYREYKVARDQLTEAIAYVQPITLTSITIGELSFSATQLNDSTVLGSTEFQVKSGQRIALVGRSGAGKTSTLLALLGAHAGVFKEVHVGQCPIDQVRLALPEFGIRYLSDTPFFEAGSVITNCQADLATCSEIIERYRLFPGLSRHDVTALLTRSIQVSGEPMSLGERQRIQLLRTLLQRPKALFLDEALSGIEEDLERQIVSLLIDDSSIEIILYTGHRVSVTDLFPHKIILSATPSVTT